MNKLGLTSLCFLGALSLTRVASATKSAELYTSTAYGYGRFEARMRVAAGDGVVSAFFLWKDGSEQPGTFWNELDFEKIGADCQLQTNALYGNPSASHTTKPTVNADLCGGYHVYAYEWTADYISWSLDGTEIRRETGDIAAAYAQNATAGLQIHFNIWPGDASFGGNFNPAILPVHQYVSWVQYSSYANGAFTLAWREEFDASTAPSGWLTGNWASPKNLSTHDPLNVNFLSGEAVLSMTADDATGPAGAMPEASGGTGGMSSTGGAPGTGGAAGTGAGGSAAGMPGAGGLPNPGSGGTSGSGGANASGATGGAGPSGGMTAVGANGGTAPATGGTGGTGAGGTSGGTGATAGVSSNIGGTGATAVGGSGATGGAPSSGGSSTGGSTAAGGADSTAGAPAGKAKDGGGADGCGCRVTGSTDSSSRGPGLGAALLLALAGAFRRRRALRARGERS